MINSTSPLLFSSLMSSHKLTEKNILKSVLYVNNKPLFLYLSIPELATNTQRPIRKYDAHALHR